MDEQTFWTTEERFWLEGAPVYKDLLDRDCVMAFPGSAILRADDVLESLEKAPRWSSVEMSDRVCASAGRTIVVLGYTAEGRREDAAPYRCVCTSTYRSEGKKWKLIQHHQSPTE